MNKTDFVANMDVIRFGHWLREGLETKRTGHRWINRRSREAWTCQSLRSAALLYNWRFQIKLPGADSAITGHTLAENGIVLNRLSAGLRQAVTRLDDHQTLEWSLAVLSWGGVTNRNDEWLQDNQVGLAAYLAHNAELLDDPLCNTDNVKNLGRYNAGMTKIYALLLDAHIMYDSRVAAALALMVRRYCEACDLSEVPEPLRFALPPGRTEANQRGPNIGPYYFPLVRGDETRRHSLALRSALNASWLLKEIVLHDGGEAVFNGVDFPDQVSPLRALEAALFMVGYDVRDPIQQQMVA